jgi:ribosomal protein S4
MNKRKHKYNPLYKNFLSLRINPLNNNKFLKLEQTTKSVNKYKTVKRWNFIKNSNKKKWEEFLKKQIRSKTFFNRYKPYTNYAYRAIKFASQGNSFKKKFKNNLLEKTTFSYLYGGLPKKYLKTQMKHIYRSKKAENPKNICAEFFESRLDSVIYRAQFCKSVRSARQLIAHKHVKVNGIVEKNKDYTLKKGDLVTFDIKQIKLIKKNLQEKFQDCPDFIMWPLPPTYLHLNYKTLEILMGNIKNFNFSSLHTFKLDTYSVIKNNHRN